eukprot:213872-Alexandrium_andersonii.AAC.1
MTAGSWDEDCAKRLMARPKVQCGVGHMCRFGLAVPKSACADGGAQACAKNQPAGGAPRPKS